MRLPINYTSHFKMPLHCLSTKYGVTKTILFDQVYIIHCIRHMNMHTHCTRPKLDWVISLIHAIVCMRCNLFLTKRINLYQLQCTTQGQMCIYELCNFNDTFCMGVLKKAKVLSLTPMLIRRLLGLSLMTQK